MGDRRPARVFASRRRGRTVPTSLGLILTAIRGRPPRSLSIRWWAVSGSLGAAAGPVVGGLLVQLSWRWIFVLNVPIGIAEVVATAALMPDIRNAGGERRSRSVRRCAPHRRDRRGSRSHSSRDPIGAGLGTRLDHVRDTRLSRVVLFLFPFGASSRAGHRPGAAARPPFAWANISMFLVSIAFAAQLLGLVLWMQEGWDWTALRTGLAIAPGPSMVSVTALGLRRFTAVTPRVRRRVRCDHDGCRRGAHRSLDRCGSALPHRGVAGLVDRRRRCRLRDADDRRGA